MPDPTEDKKRLRHHLLQQRKRAAERYRNDRDAQENLLALFRQFLTREYRDSPPSPVSGYLPIREEIDPRPLMETLRVRHKTTLLLPVVVAADTPLVFRAFDGNVDTLQTGAFATRHPPSSAREEIPALMLVPLLAFDNRCTRLGYGGGFYDRTLETYVQNSAQTFALGIAFDAQRVESLPAESHDKPLDAVLSEKTLYRRD